MGELTQDFGTTASAIGNHKREIERLQQLQNVDVNVTVTTHRQRLLLAPGMLARLPELGVEGVMWIPPAAKAEEVKMEESTEVAKVEMCLSIVHPVQGKFVRQWGTNGGSSGEGVAVSDGEVFVCDSYCRIQVCGLDGSFVRQWGTEGEGEGQFKYPTSVAVSSGELYVCEHGNHRMQVFGLDGSFLRQWGTKGAGDGEFSGPRDVAVSGGEVFVCDSNNCRIQVFELGGSFVRQWGTMGSGEGHFLYPDGVVVSDGEVFVCDSCNHRIQVFRRDESFVRQWGTGGTGEGQFQYPMGVAVSGEDVYVCDSLNHRIQVFGLDASFVRQWGTAGEGEGNFKDPRGVAVSDGMVYVRDYVNHHCIQVFRLDGSFSHQWVMELGEVAPGSSIVTVRCSCVITSTTASRCLGWMDRFHASGARGGRWGGVFTNPGDMVVSGGEVYVCANWHGTYFIQVFGLDGLFVRQWDTKVRGEGHMAVSDGELFLSDVDSRMKVFN